jgi:hypothetical protein
MVPVFVPESRPPFELDIESREQAVLVLNGNEMRCRRRVGKSEILPGVAVALGVESTGRPVVVIGRPHLALARGQRRPVVQAENGSGKQAKE